MESEDENGSICTPYLLVQTFSTVSCMADGERPKEHPPPLVGHLPSEYKKQEHQHNIVEVYGIQLLIRSACFDHPLIIRDLLCREAHGSCMCRVVLSQGDF